MGKKTIIAGALGFYAFSCGGALAEESPMATMKTAKRSTMPIGHFELCKSTPAECRPMEWGGPLKMTDNLMATLIAVNRRVNHTIRSVEDQELYGVEERWAYPEDAGDVEDFALLKRRELQKEGIELSNLLIAVARNKDEDGTAVLVVTTDKGDFVLDQATDDIKIWSEVPYEFLKRQAHENSGVWLRIEDQRKLD